MLVCVCVTFHLNDSKEHDEAGPHRQSLLYQSPPNKQKQIVATICLLFDLNSYCFDFQGYFRSFEVEFYVKSYELL